MYDDRSRRVHSKLETRRARGSDNERLKLIIGRRLHRNGGCHSCARGILEYLQQSNLPHEMLVEKVVIADTFSPAHHVAVRITTPDQEWYLDANGVSSRQELLSSWEMEEGLSSPSIEVVRDDAWLEEEIALLPHVSACVTNLLREQLGLFSPSWLQDETEGVICSQRFINAIRERSQEMVLQ